MNIYLLISGVLLSLLSFAHVAWGNINVLKEAADSNLSQLGIISVYVPWYQVGYALLLLGVSIIILTALKKGEALKVFSIIVLAQLIGNLVIFVLVTLSKQQYDTFSQTLPQLVLYIVLIVLISLGIKKQKALQASN
jgi:hypothetical protein